MSPQGSTRGGAGGRNTELISQVQGIEVFPPRLDIVDKNVQHCVFGPFLDIVALEKKSVRSEAQFGERLPESVSFEPNRLIETQACFEFLRWEERTKRANSWNETSDGVHRYSLYSGLVHTGKDNRSGTEEECQFQSGGLPGDGTVGGESNQQGYVSDSWLLRRAA